MLQLSIKTFDVVLNSLRSLFGSIRLSFQNKIKKFQNLSHYTESLKSPTISKHFMYSNPSVCESSIFFNQTSHLLQPDDSPLQADESSSARCLISHPKDLRILNMGAAETKPPTHRNSFPKLGPSMGEMYLNNTFNGFIYFSASFWCNKIPISLL